MKKFLSFAVVAFLSTSIFAQSTWTVDKAHAQVSFGITHLGISEIEGQFNEFDATITSSEEDFSDAVFDVNIEVSSVDTGIEMRDNHLRNADFFDVEKFPGMNFKSNSIEKVSEGKYKVSGDLTFHGVTKPVSLDVWHRGTIEQKGKQISGFQVTGTISRADFNFGSDFPEAVLSDEVRIKVDGEFKKA